jgi:hypothetical protein
VILDGLGSPVDTSVVSESGFRYDLVGVPEPGAPWPALVGAVVLALAGMRTRSP